MTSRTSPLARRRHRVVALALLATTMVPGLTQLPALAGSAAPAEPPTADEVVTLGDTPAGLADIDLRDTLRPTQAQRSAAAALGAVDVRWNRLGTPTSLLPADGSLGAASSSDPVAAARAWLRDHAAVFGLTAADMDALELVNNQRLAQSPARAVLFTQRYGDLLPALNGLVTVGIANGQVEYVSSSLSSRPSTPEAAVLTPVVAWTKAAASVGRTVALPDIQSVVDDGWTKLTVDEFAQEQHVRLRALDMGDGEVRPVFEANVVDVEGGATLAHTVLVDAVHGTVLHRENLVEHSNDFTPFQGEITGTTCGEQHPFELTDGNTRQINVVAAAANTANDIVIKLLDDDNNVLAEGDLLTSPETLRYSPSDGSTIPQGVYNVQICPFEGIAFLPPQNYAGMVSTSDESGGTPTLPLPAWRYFPSNPVLNYSPDHTPRNRATGCWKIRERNDCTLSSGYLDQLGHVPWDYSLQTESPTLTSTGNNAETREAWGSPLTPGGYNQRPVSPTREYFDEFSDDWNNTGCDEANLVPGGNDIFAATTNLFVAHNRMHNYSYGLGFTELNYNMQVDNRGKNADPSRDGDPEVGNVQAGAIGGLQSGLGRDNANQITQQDGIPGITNQYLFQPIAGAFYAPCVDGALDMSITGHEYTHAISNRMIGGPDQGIDSEQGGAMGESWGDLVAGEYMFSHGYKTGANPWAVGPYATGNGSTGIRNFAINENPLNFGNRGYDSVGDQVHADGEIWNGTMWTVRQAMVKRWDFGVHRYSNLGRQRLCAEGSSRQGPLKATRCPGNRRWVAVMFDSFLLQQGATSMLDARDAFIAADRMRFDNGKNQRVIWNAFARRGFGKGASTPNADSGRTKPSFVSPRSKNTSVRFDTAGKGKIYVGVFEARSTPVADTLGSTKRNAKASFTPGRYRMLYVSEKRGATRFTLRVRADQRTKVVEVGSPVNLASQAAGAKVIDTSADSRNPGFLIDGTEETNWGGVNEDGTSVDARRPFVAVDLAGQRHTVRRVNVSAMLTPASDDPLEIPLARDEDPDSGSRFTALRKFALEACVRQCGSDSATWKRFYSSPGNAFPSTRPRPTSPTLRLRSFNVPDVRAAAVRLVVLENQCTGFQGYAGDQDNDDSNNTDCKTGSDRDSIVHVSELQVY